MGQNAVMKGARINGHSARLDQMPETQPSGQLLTDQEVRARCLAFIETRRNARRDGKCQDDLVEILAWTDLCHVLINMKVFIFID